MWVTTSTDPWTLWARRFVTNADRVFKDGKGVAPSHAIVELATEAELLCWWIGGAKANSRPTSTRLWCCCLARQPYLPVQGCAWQGC